MPSGLLFALVYSQQCQPKELKTAELDPVTVCVFFAEKAKNTITDVNITDANSPGASRSARVYTSYTVDTIANTTVDFEFWGPNAPTLNFTTTHTDHQSFVRRLMAPAAGRKWSSQQSTINSIHRKITKMHNKHPCLMTHV